MMADSDNSKKNKKNKKERDNGSSEEIENNKEDARKEVARENKDKRFVIDEIAKEDTQGVSEEAKLILKEVKGLQEADTSEGASASAAEETKTDNRYEEEHYDGEKYRTLEESVMGQRVPEVGQDETYTIPQQHLNPEYVQTLSYRPVEELHKDIESIYVAASQRGYITSQDMRHVEEVAAGLERKLESPYELPTDGTQAVDAIQQLRISIRGMYQEKKNKSTEQKKYDPYWNN